MVLRTSKGLSCLWSNPSLGFLQGLLLLSVNRYRSLFFCMASLDFIVPVSLLWFVGSVKNVKQKMIVPLAIQRGILLMRLDVEEQNLFFLMLFFMPIFFFGKNNANFFFMPSSFPQEK